MPSIGAVSEVTFQKWWKKIAKVKGWDADYEKEMRTNKHDYDYRALFYSGKAPDPDTATYDTHFDSGFKDEFHSRRWWRGIDSKGPRANEIPSNADELGGWGATKEESLKGGGVMPYPKEFNTWYKNNVNINPSLSAAQKKEMKAQYYKEWGKSGGTQYPEEFEKYFRENASVPGDISTENLNKFKAASFQQWKESNKTWQDKVRDNRKVANAEAAQVRSNAQSKRIGKAITGALPEYPPQFETWFNKNVKLSPSVENEPKGAKFKEAKSKYYEVWKKQQKPGGVKPRPGELSSLAESMQTQLGKQDTTVPLEKLGYSTSTPKTVKGVDVVNAGPNLAVKSASEKAAETAHMKMLAAQETKKLEKLPSKKAADAAKAAAPGDGSKFLNKAAGAAMLAQVGMQGYSMYQGRKDAKRARKEAKEAEEKQERDERREKWLNLGRQYIQHQHNMQYNQALIGMLGTMNEQGGGY